MKNILYLILILVLSSCSGNNYNNYDGLFVEDVPESIKETKKTIYISADIVKAQELESLTPEDTVELIQSVKLTDKKGNNVDNTTFDAEFFREQNLKSYANSGKVRFFTFPYNKGEHVIVFPKFLFSDSSFRDILNKKDFDIAIPYPFDLSQKIPTINHFNKHATSKDMSDLLDFLLGKIMVVTYSQNGDKPFVKLSTAKYGGGNVDVFLVDENGDNVHIDMLIKNALKSTVGSLNYFQRNLLKVATIGEDSKLNKLTILIPKEKIGNYK